MCLHVAKIDSMSQVYIHNWSFEPILTKTLKYLPSKTVRPNPLVSLFLKPENEPTSGVWHVFAYCEKICRNITKIVSMPRVYIHKWSFELNLTKIFNYPKLSHFWTYCWNKANFGILFHSVQKHAKISRVSAVCPKMRQFGLLWAGGCQLMLK